MQRSEPPPQADEMLGLTVHSLPSPGQGLAAHHQRRGRWKMLAVLAVCAAPVVASYFTYYVIRPAQQRSFGELMAEQAALPDVQARTLDGKHVALDSLKGQWLLISTGPGACPESCVRGLFVLRNSHASQGKEVERLERIWIITDDAPPAAVVSEAYAGTHVLRADPATLAAWLVPDATDPATALAHGLWIVDPLGHLMMHFPDAEQPEDVRDDIRTLLKNSRIG